MYTKKLTTKEIKKQPQEQETTFDRYCETNSTNSTSHMCEYCISMNMSPSEYSSEILTAKVENRCHSCGKILSLNGKNDKVVNSSPHQTLSSIVLKEEVEVEVEEDKEALARRVALQATLAASMGILAGVSYHLVFDRRFD